MAITFRKEEEWFTFYDSKGEFIERKTEIRFDPLTGESSRLVFDAGLAPSSADYSEAAELTKGKNCPFCSENVLKMTPVFSKEIVKEGRIFQGDAVLFPNLFPYSKHNGVVVFSAQHYVQLGEFTAPLIKDAFLAAQQYISNVVATDPEVKFASINWNYLPSSGGSILHPHLHVIISESPTNYQALTLEKGHAFTADTGNEYFNELYEAEKTNSDRWIGEKGDVAWIHAFAPKSHNDLIGIFTNSNNVYDISEEDWYNFSEGLTAIFAGFIEQGFSSFNLSLHVPVDQRSKQPVHVRLIPRLTLGQLGTSDINFFQALHQEPLTYKAPEEIAKKMRIYF